VSSPSSHLSLCLSFLIPSIEDRPSNAFTHARSYGPACWLWDYLRRSGTSGYFVPLSGGIDSCATATIVFNMCRLVCQAAKEGSELLDFSFSPSLHCSPPVTWFPISHSATLQCFFFQIAQDWCSPLRVSQMNKSFWTPAASLARPPTVPRPTFPSTRASSAAESSILATWGRTTRVRRRGRGRRIWRMRLARASDRPLCSSLFLLHWSGIGPACTFSAQRGMADARTTT